MIFRSPQVRDRTIASYITTALQTPSTIIVCPVTKDAASEQSQTTASVFSSDCPVLPRFAVRTYAC
jgi:hypothetical protein